MDAKILQSKKVTDADKKKKRGQIILLLVLVGLLVFVALNTFVFGKKKAKPTPASASNPVAAVVENTVNSAEGMSPVVLEEDLEAINDSWGASPFSLKDDLQEDELIETEEDLNLQALIYGPKGESYAMINEKIVKKGDRIADKTVTEINEAEVLLRDGEGQSFVLKN